MKWQWLTLAAALYFVSPRLAFAQASAPIANDNSGSSGTDWAARKAEAEAETAAYNAQAAAANAETAMINAQLGVEKAKYAVEGQSTITGSTDATSSGKPEALVLVWRSSQASADSIYAKLKGEIAARPEQALLILTSATEAEAADAILFDVRVKMLESAFASASTKFQAATDHDPGKKATTSAEGDKRSAGSGLSKLGVITGGLSKLGSYFLSDYKFHNVDITNPGAAIADHIAGKAKAECPSRLIIVAGRLLPTDTQLVMTPLVALDKSAQRLISEHAVSQSRAAALRQAKEEQAALQFDAAAAAAAKALDTYDALLKALAADPPANASSLFSRIVRQKKVLDTMKANALVLMIDSVSASQLYTKKNLWTFFGGPPVYTTGASAITYALVDSANSGVLAAGQVATHAGYHSIREVQRAFRPR